MRTLQLKLPHSLKQNDDELKMLIAAKLYEDGALTSGQAAEVAGVSKREFIERLGKYGVSLFSDSANDLRSDLDNA